MLDALYSQKYPASRCMERRKHSPDHDFQHSQLTTLELFLELIPYRQEQLKRHAKSIDTPELPDQISETPKLMTREHQPLQAPYSA